MKHYFLLTALFLIFSITFNTAQAQCMQKVRVLEYNGAKEKTPLANVEVVVSNAGSSVSDKEGRCTLQFRTLRPGDKVRIRRIDKPGFLVFNNDNVSNWHISSGDDEFIIVMCKEEIIMDLRRKYRNSVTSSYQNEYTSKEKVIANKLHIGDYSERDYAIELEKLKAEYDKKLDNIDNYIDRFVFVDLTNLNEEEKKIHDLVAKGKYLEAIKAYEDFDAIGLYKKEMNTFNEIQASQSAIEKKQEELIEQRRNIYYNHRKQLDLLRMQGGAANIEKAWAMEKEFAYIDTTYITPLIDYANSCIQANRVEEADKAIQICLNSTDPEVKLQGEILRCQVYYKRNQFIQIKNDLKRISDYLRTQSKEKKYDELYLSERSNVLGMLVVASNSTMDTIMSRKYLDEMFEISKLNFYLNNNDETKRQLADAYHNAFIYYHNIGDHQTALKMIDTALVYANELYESGGRVQPVLLAFYSSHKATLLSSMHKYDEALHAYRNAEKLYEQSNQINPKAYANYLAENCLNLIEMFINTTIYPDKESTSSSTLDFALCAPLLIAAEKYINEEMSLNPTSAQNKLSWLYSEYCLYYFLRNEFALGTEYFYKATELKTEYMEDNPIKSQNYVKDLHEKVLAILRKNPEANADRIKRFEEGKSKLRY